MSLKTFLSHIWDEIKSIFVGLPGDLKVAIHIGVEVTEGIKDVIDNPVTDILTAIIPVELDDEIKDKLRAELPKILTELKLADSCGQLTDPNEITACALKVLGDLTGDIKNSFLHTLSVLIAQVAADGKLSWADGVYLLQWYYENKEKAVVSVGA